MARNAKADVPADMWLHVAADALARYAAGGGTIEVEGDDAALVIRLSVTLDDARLPAAFVALATATAAPGDDPGHRPPLLLQPLGEKGAG